jgi:hypothetical protein
MKRNGNRWDQGSEGLTRRDQTEGAETSAARARQARMASRIRYEARAEGDLGSSSARRERTGAGRGHLWWSGGEERSAPSLPPSPPPRGEGRNGEEADAAASVSRLTGELDARAAAAASARSRHGSGQPTAVDLAWSSPPAQGEASGELSRGRAGVKVAGGPS